ncbi:MAG TPA: hypothetical protein VGB66_03870 [Longimicrobium sp.]|jgi:hypothetical protein
METTIDTERPRAFDPSQATPGAIPPRPSWDPATEQRIGDGEGLAQILGYLSVGLGLVQVVAPERIGARLGMEDWSELIRAYGVREIASGMGILTQPDPASWVWARVAGDAIDLATLATRLTPGNPRRRNVAALMAAIAGLTVLDVVCGRALAKRERH